MTLRHHGGLDAVLVEAARERSGVEVRVPGCDGGDARGRLTAAARLLVLRHGQLRQAGRPGEAGNLRDDGELSLWGDGRGH